MSEVIDNPRNDGEYEPSDRIIEKSLEDIQVIADIVRRCESELIGKPVEPKGRIQISQL